MQATIIDAERYNWYKVGEVYEVEELTEASFKVKDKNAYIRKDHCKITGEIKDEAEYWKTKYFNLVKQQAK